MMSPPDLRGAVGKFDDHILRMSEGYDHADAVRERIEEQRARERRERIVTWLCLSAALFAAVVFALQFIVRSSGL